MTKINIKDLRGVGDVELNLDDTKRVFVFFGSNGVGKTKTLEALCFYFLARTKNFYPRNVQWNDNVEFFYSVSQYNNSINSSYGDSFRFKKSAKKKFLFGELFLLNEWKYSALAYLGSNARSQLFNKPSEAHTIKIKSTVGSEISETINEAIFNGEMSYLGMDVDVHNWFIERAKSVNPYQVESQLKKTELDTVLQCLNKIDPLFSSDFLQINDANQVYLKIDNQKKELSELSSGFISVVKIIQSIINFYSGFTGGHFDLLNVKGVVLIDEIESHLHIEWQTKIVPTLKNLFPNTTFYIATHSPLVLSQLAEGEAYLLKRDADDVVRSQEINSPNTRLLENVLQDAFDVDLNQLKRENMEHIDQTKAKQKLLALLNK